jgi:hypothetical protein
VFVRRANKLFALVGKINDPSSSARRAKAFDKDVTAFNRDAKRHGLSHRPRGLEEIGLLLVDKIDQQTRALQGILDVLRWEVSASLSRRLAFVMEFPRVCFVADPALIAKAPSS